MFFITLQQVVKLLLFLLIGFALHQQHVLPENTPAVLSKLLYYCLLPSLLFSSFFDNFTLHTLQTQLPLLSVSACILVITIFFTSFLAYIISPDPYDRGICRYSMIVPNTGYVGTALVLALFGSDSLMRMHLFCIPLSLFTYSEGIRTLRGGGKMSLRGFINPILFAILLGMVCGLFEFSLPTVITETLAGCGSCLSPIAMILTGFTIAQYRLDTILRDWRVYTVVGIRMVIMPLLLLVVGRLLNLSAEIMLNIGVVYTMPTGLNTVIVPASVGRNAKLGTGMACVSNMLSLVTIPLFFSLFIR